jgi:hypothetical protein
VIFLAAALLILGPTRLPPERAIGYHRIELWVPTPGTSDYEWRCLQDRNQPSLNYMVLSCALNEVETFDYNGRDTKEFLNLLPK